jgi:hypothetical protein
MMSSFVFIFRQSSRNLTVHEQKQRTQEVRSWALQQVKEHDLDPRVLGGESRRFDDGTVNRSEEASVIGFNFIEAKDFGEAVQVAQTHPGLRYGVSIEVRPWTDPRTQ